MQQNHLTPVQYRWIEAGGTFEEFRIKFGNVQGAYEAIVFQQGLTATKRKIEADKRACEAELMASLPKAKIRCMDWQDTSLDVVARIMSLLSDGKERTRDEIRDRLSDVSTEQVNAGLTAMMRSHYRVIDQTTMEGRLQGRLSAFRRLDANA